MNSRMRTSRQGLALIKRFEGFRETAKRLPDGRWTIGYGHVRSAREGVTITVKDGEDLLRFDLAPVEEALNEWVLSPLQQNQFDALASLVFNISPGQFRDSMVLNRLNAGDHLGAASEFDAWRRARINGKLIVVDALVRRRAMERALFLKPDERLAPAPTPLVTPVHDTFAPRSAGGAQNDDAAEPTPEAVTQAVRGLVEGGAPPQGTPRDPKDVTRRIAMILDREEAAADDREAVRATVSLEHSPPAKAANQNAATAAPRRVAIDDTETLDPATLEEVMRRIEQGPPPSRNPPTRKQPRDAGGGPWIVLVALSAIGLGALAVDWAASVREGAATNSLAPIVVIGSGLLLGMSTYFLLRSAAPKRR